MPVVFDDDVAPATDPNPPKMRGRFVADAAPPATSPTAAPPVGDSSPSLFDRIDQFSKKYNPIDLRERGGEPVIPNPIHGFLTRGGEGLETLGGKIVAGLHGLMGASPDQVEQDRAALTPTPANTPSTQQFEDLAGHATQPVRDVVQPVANYIDKTVDNAGPLVRTAVPAAEEAVQDIAQVLPLGAVGRVAKVADAAATVEGSAAPSTATPLETARGAGYQAPPSVVKASNPGTKVPGTTREAIVGPSGVQADANVGNQQITTGLAGKELGLDNATKITADDAATFRKNGPGPIYDSTATKLGTFGNDQTAVGELDRISSNTDPATRVKPAVGQKIDQITAQIQNGTYNGSNWVRDVSYLRENGAREAAGTLEDMAERHLTDPADLASYKGARQAFAKSYDIQNAIGRGGQIDAQQLRALDDKYPGLLTGNLKIIATAARELPEVTRLPGAETGGGVHTKFQAVHNAVGAVIKKLPGMDVSSPDFQSRNFGREQTPTEATYNSTFGRKDQAPPTERAPDPTGGLTLSNDTGPLQPPTPRGSGISLADVLSTGVERPAPLGLALAPDYRPTAGDAVPFRRDAGQLAGDLQLADSAPRGAVENNSDLGHVLSQGVPEGIAARVAPDAKLRSKDTVPFTPDVIPLGKKLAPKKKSTRGDSE